MQANRKLRRIVVLLAASCVLRVAVLLRIAGTEPPRPIVIRVDEVGRAEAMAYKAATAQADPFDPTAKYFLNRFVADVHSRRRATVEEHWTRSLRFLSTDLANAAFQRDGRGVATAAGTAETEVQVENVVLRIHPSPDPPHGATADFGLVHVTGARGCPARAVVAHGPTRSDSGKPSKTDGAPLPDPFGRNKWTESDP